MFGRLIKIATIYLPIGLILGYFLITAEDQGPWLIALVAFFVVAAVIANIYFFFGGRKKD